MGNESESLPPPAEPPVTNLPPAAPPERASSGCRWVLLALGIMALVALAFFLGMLAMWFRDRSSQTQQLVNTTTVVTQVQALSEVVTVKYVMEKVVILEDPRWYGENRILLLAHGVVKAGIDLRDLGPDDIEITGRKVTITLPVERITDAYLDERRTHVIEHNTGLIRQFNKDLESNARRMAVADIRTAARSNGILTDARERAELLLKNLFLQLGFEEVEFRRPPPIHLPGGSATAPEE